MQSRIQYFSVCATSACVLLTISSSLLQRITTHTASFDNENPSQAFQDNRLEYLTAQPKIHPGRANEEGDTPFHNGGLHLCNLWSVFALLALPSLLQLAGSGAISLCLQRYGRCDSWKSKLEPEGWSLVQEHKTH
ncbi:hypothetical protein BT63DRAFT_22575 [Microthyrium microscopicum]|uniref:Transmembrane protein n=1 Tax=Microthyrium microscopicum TaxID=703497 RepID=A0A6A6USU8_9PEZI|nr:hypothetical protein BT63DRAFT_22575 [Microthyrium microscopicum]